jgi:predicted RNA-binding Zn-ribbon protein involved in translation (DUF1610 family)
MPKLTDKAFVERAVAAGHISATQGEECLELVRRMADKGTPVAVAAALVSRGYLTDEQARALRYGNELLHWRCPECGAEYRTLGDRAQSNRGCPKCSAELVAASQQQLPHTPPPAEPSRPAMQAAAPPPAQLTAAPTGAKAQAPPQELPEPAPPAAQPPGPPLLPQPAPQFPAQPQEGLAQMLQPAASSPQDAAPPLDSSAPPAACVAPQLARQPTPWSSPTKLWDLWRSRWFLTLVLTPVGALALWWLFGALGVR